MYVCALLSSGRTPSFAEGIQTLLAYVREIVASDDCCRESLKLGRIKGLLKPLEYLWRGTYSGANTFAVRVPIV